MLRAFLLAVAGLTGMIFVGMVVQLVQAGLDIVQLRQAIPYVLLYATPYAVPVGLLISGVLTFGRMAGDNEIAAIRCSGLHLWVVFAPALCFAAAITTVALMLSVHVLPWAYRRVRELRNIAIQPYIDALGTMRTKVQIFPYELQVGSVVKSAEGKDTWRNVAVIRYAGEFISEIVIAEEGFCVIDQQAKKAHIALRHGRAYKPELKPTGSQRFVKFGESSVTIDFGQQSKAHLHRAKYLSFDELLRRRRDLQKRLAAIPRMISPNEAKKRAQREYNEHWQLMAAVAGELDVATQRWKAAAWELQRRETRLKAALEAEAELSRKILELEAEIARSRARVARLSQESSLESQTLEKEETQKLREHEKRREEAESARVSRERESAQLRAAVEETMAAVESARQQMDSLQRRYEAHEQKRKELDRKIAVAAWQVERLEVETELHTRFTGAVTCFLFALIGMALGVIVKRGNVIVALGASALVIMLFYYPLQTIAEMAAASGAIRPGVVLWTPNFALAALGLVLTWRVAGR